MRAMLRAMGPVVLVLVMLTLAGERAVAQHNWTLENVMPPEANRGDEPRAASFSLEAAARFLDQAALDWTKNRKCFTCHTNYSYLLARPAVSSAAPAHAEVRAALEVLVEERWPDKGPRWDAEVVMSAAVLALNDAATTGSLHATTRRALDRIWTVQREDGGFDWLKCDWPPMESDDHYGATMAAIAVGGAPGDYAQTDAAQAGLGRLREYFQNNPPANLHQTAMLIWADSHVPGLIDQGTRSDGVARLLELQREDGGWALAALGQWQRSDGKMQDLQSSDGYATGFTLYVLRRAGVPADEVHVKRGVAWLKSNQRASGRWFTRSLNKDNKHYISHAGTAFAVLALQACQPAAAE